MDSSKWDVALDTFEHFAALFVFKLNAMVEFIFIAVNFIIVVVEFELIAVLEWTLLLRG